ncbi:MAG: outer membrane protein assembly factor BamA [Bacteroidaceae bacterium]|nr:outer membrane protein assembly factor BamA [Bacteroidaceae bacterium]
MGRERTAIRAQQPERVVNPVIDYARSPQEYIIGGITVQGVKDYDEMVLINLSGLSKGRKVTIPGDDLTKAVKRYWRNGLFSHVSIRVDSIVHDSAYICITLATQSRVSQINYNGVKKSEREDLETKMGLRKDSPLSVSRLERAKTLAKRYFDDKGFKNADIQIVPHDDVSNPGSVILDVNIDKKDKVKVNSIQVEGNANLPISAIKGTLFKNGAFKKTHERGKLSSWFRSKKFIDEKWKEDKRNLITKYNAMGYRDARIVTDSVKPHDENSVDVYVKVEEGQRYYVRDITWVGNTLYPAEFLNEKLRMKKGDVYNQEHLQKRLSQDDDAIGNLYYNNGYVFYQLEPVEVNVVGDSIDLEMRITEDRQAYISHVNITGNDRVYEQVVRRELDTKPGDLFTKDALERSYRQIAAMGHFDPEHIDYKIQDDRENGTVDLTWALDSKSNDQVEFSLGYGQTGVIGKIGLKFTNFCMANLFKKGGLRRGILPNGNGETFSISGQTNGRYYQAYSINYVNPWFGGKRPTSFTVSAFFSRQTDVSDRYYNSAYYNSYYNYLYGYGNTYSNYYENFYDPDKYVMIYGASLGWGKRLTWPDDYFQLSADLSYTRYNLKQWRYFLITDGNCNNLSLNINISRSNTGSPIYPRSGSEFLFSASLTPPYSLWDGKDYKNLANNYLDANYQRQQQEKYRWIEYHKWKFKARTFTPLSSAVKCPVIMTRVEVGLLGSYNKYKKSPFETFYVGGDGMSGYSYSYATETIGLRGYDNGSLTPSGYSGYAYDRFTVELRYPFILSNSTNIYGLAFAEGGNAWNRVKDFNPFDLKRSAGVGVRIFLPMVGLLGIDWAYGFDKVFGRKGGSNFHFILGQEF